VWGKGRGEEGDWLNAWSDLPGRLKADYCSPSHLRLVMLRIMLKLELVSTALTVTSGRLSGAKDTVQSPTFVTVGTSAYDSLFALIYLVLSITHISILMKLGHCFKQRRDVTILVDKLALSPIRLVGRLLGKAVY
jgi:hypothetical protein